MVFKLISLVFLKMTPRQKVFAALRPGQLALVL
ncbi:hypothetical protein RSal33209_0895 [Renibacterium salmoninarum ATCC 33209]|uniref:Uncharacterized protein n=1 Tax=Renibacterium salmoninarum (strain ATCC 33209 / DSM 20767 / JCM 11484 / NBRC 15589 / NCIMB 2235) TaxID=288705 RepID=A9WQN9_RENSM|nr:hypothetical protein RSal33209_0895 [Renibacterium salmoninarum ATCC 33209]